jgi:hypothetical protein
MAKGDVVKFDENVLKDRIYSILKISDNSIDFFFVYS